MNVGTRASACAALVACCCGGFARESQAQATLDLDLGVESSDNVTRVDENEQSDTIGVAGVAFGLEQIRPRLEARIGADLQYQRYFDDTYDDEVVGGLSADVAWSILPERFIWVVQDNYGQIAGNRQQPDTPDNREDFNYFTTGPDLIIPLGARTAAELSGRWSDVYYEESEQGSRNVEGSAALGREISEQSTVSLNGSVEDIEYDEEVFEDYRITENFLRLEVLGGRTTMMIDVGYTEAERGEDSSDGALGRLTVSREVTSRTTLTLDAGSEFADTATSFRLDQAAIGVGPDAQDAVASADVFRTTYAYLGLDTQRSRTTFNVTIFGRKERHETETVLDRDSIGLGFDWSRRLSQRVDLDARALYTDEEFVAAAVSFKEWSVGAGLAWRMTPSVSLRLTVDHFDGSSDDALRDYDENRAYLGIRYSRRR